MSDAPGLFRADGLLDDNVEDSPSKILIINVPTYLATPKLTQTLLASLLMHQQGHFSLKVLFHNGLYHCLLQLKLLVISYSSILIND
jgi:hypothetical protein